MMLFVNTPPAKAGSIGHSADYPLSHRERAGVRGSDLQIAPLYPYTLILPFSRREKEPFYMQRPHAQPYIFVIQAVSIA